MDLAEVVSTFLRILPQAIVSGVALGSVYALIAQGYYVTFTTTETVNFAQGEFLMVGALTSYTLLVLSGLNFLVALVVVIVLMGSWASWWSGSQSARSASCSRSAGS